VIPALLTSTPMAPSWFATVAMAIVTSDSSVTSQLTVSAAALTAAAGRRSSAATLKPSWASRAQVAADAGSAPPVTTATRPAVRSQVHRAGLARAQPTELDEVLRVEEQLVQLGYLVHGEALGYG
jgi:hypothetical protein